MIRQSFTFLPLALLVGANALGGVAVRNNHFIDTATNETVVLRGVSHSSGEYACVQGKGTVFEGPVSASFVAAIKSWGNNAVRIPLNADCWLGLNGASPGGSAYQQEVARFVQLLTGAGVAAILDLHWTADGSLEATKQVAMPDASHAPAFWSSVATAFKHNPLALFELYNEPFPDKGAVSNATWQCLRAGGNACAGRTGVDYTAAGLQDLLDAVRGAGAANVVLASGLVWTNHLDGWLDHKPHDALGQLGAVWHSYDFNACKDQQCWEQTVAAVAERHPVLVTESGFAISYVQKLWPWCEAQGVSYMAWTWNTWAKEGLIKDWDGTPSDSWGAAWKAQLANLPAPTPAPAPPPAGCPGDSLSACIALCPADPAARYQACVKNCAKLCT
eukprot:g145.t1